MTEQANNLVAREDGSIEALEAAYKRTLERVHELEAVIRDLRSALYATQETTRQAIQRSHIV